MLYFHVSIFLILNDKKNNLNNKKKINRFDLYYFLYTQIKSLHFDYTLIEINNLKN